MRPSNPSMERLPACKGSPLASNTTIQLQTEGRGLDYPCTPPERAICFMTTSWQCPYCMQKISVRQAIVPIGAFFPLQQYFVYLNPRHKQAKSARICPAKAYIQIIPTSEPVDATFPWLEQV